MSLVSELKEWGALSNRAGNILKNKQLFIKTRENCNLSHRYLSLGLNLNYQLIDPDVFKLLQNYSRKIQGIPHVESIFKGEALNTSENRPVTHAAYRSLEFFNQASFYPTLKSSVLQTLERIKSLSEQLREKTNKITDVVNIGIGGSDLGPKFILDALKEHKSTPLNFHFISNIDPYAHSLTLKSLDPQKTIIFISSKSFGTFETIENAKTALAWLGTEKRREEQVFAITEKVEKAVNFGINEKNILSMHPGVGGRFSVFSSIGALIAIAIGFEGFAAFLKGGHLFDEHVLERREENLAHVMALVDFWNINFLKINSQAIIPYSEQLTFLIPYIQQLMMESNGKRVTRMGAELNYPTCPIIWGGIGSASQHSFHQLLMQGTNNLSVDFIKVKSPTGEHHHLQSLLNHQLNSQSQALWFGNEKTEKDGLKTVKGLQQHSIIELDEITPQTLGILLAFYEYRTIYLGRFWEINSFDQPGVELGKNLSLRCEEPLEDLIYES